MWGLFVSPAHSRYNGNKMKIQTLHDWNLSISQAMDAQRRLSSSVIREGGVTSPRYIAGVDMSFDRYTKTGTAAVVVLRYPEIVLEEVQTATGRTEFPYVPGLLSFREAPLALAAFEKLHTAPDLVIVDGQGYAHPRRMGIACHIGLFLDIPTIGCAKSRLCGTYKEPGQKAGSLEYLMDDDEIIGAVARTKSGVKALYISVGHKISLENAVYWVSACCRGHRLPEPSRLAHLAAGGNLKTPAVSSSI